MEKIIIAYAPNDKYVNQAIVSMASAVNNKDKFEIEFVLLYSSLTDENINKFKDFEQRFGAKVHYTLIDEKDFANFPYGGWVSVQTWFRTKIPDVCKNFSRVLYLDCDTMINSSLDAFWQTNLDRAYMGVVQDIWNNDRHVRELEMNDKIYFNAGMSLINCDFCRENDLFKDVKAYVDLKGKSIKMYDQDALNKVVDEKKVLVHPKYDFMDTWWRNYYYEYEGEYEKMYLEAQKNPAIVHFTGLKPCFKGCGNAFKEIWWQHAKTTSIYNELLDEFKKSVEPQKKEKFIDKIFSIKNEHYYKNKWKVLTIFGIKFKRKIRQNNVLKDV